VDLSTASSKEIFESIAANFVVTIRYPPIVDLFERLFELASFAELHADRLPDLPDFLDKQRIQTAQQYLIQRGLGRQGSVREGNPAFGLYGKSPLASAVMQSADIGCKEIYDGICILLILYCTEQNSPSARDEASHEVRQSARSVNPRYHLLSKLPFLTNASEDYHLIIRAKLQTIETENVTKAQHKLFYVLQNLSSLERKRTKPSRKENDLLTTIIDSKKNGVWNEIKLPGNIKQVYESSAESGEPPIKTTVFESDTEAEHDPIIFDYAVRKAKSWVQKSETFSRVDTTALNELERTEFVAQLKLLLKKQFGESVIGFAIALVYLLGLELIQILSTRWGAVGFIDLQGRLIKALPDLPRVFRSEQSSELSLCYLPLPSLVSSWIKQHSQQLAGSDSLLAATGQTESGFVSKIHSLLNSWRRYGRYRFKLPKLAAALSAELTYQTRDPLIITTLAGDLKNEPPVLMYYRVLKHDELSQVYQKTTDSLLNIPEDLLGFDFGSSTELPGNVKGLVDGITAKLKSKLNRYPADIIQSHNAFMYFTLTMMLFATGHRPVRDPFCWWDELDVNYEGSLISDKVVSLRHEYRYQVIPKIAQAQLRTYRRHLRQLGARLYRDKSLKRQQLGVTILSCLEGSSKNMPVFFEIDELGVKYFSVTQKSLQTYWQQFTELPTNAGRSVMCQLLVDNGVPSGIVELYLGHIHGLSHRHGPRAGHAPAVDFTTLAKEIEQVMKKLGWQHLSPFKQNRDRIRLPKKFKHQLQTSQSTRAFGPEKRRLIRVKNEIQIKQIITSARFDIFIKANNRYFPKEQVNQFFDRIKIDCHHAGLSIQRGTNLASRWLVNEARRGVTIEDFRPARTITAESSVISQKIFQDRQNSKKLQLSLLSEFSIQQKPDSVEKSLAEIVVTAAVFGGLAKPEALKILPEHIFTDVFRIGVKGGIIEFKEHRWLPDSLTLSRIIYIRNHYSSEQVLSGIERLQSQLVLYLKKHALKCNQDNVFRRLSELAQAFNSWDLPGAFHNYWMPKSEGRHLPLHRLNTLLEDKPYLPKNISENVVEDYELDWLPALSKNHSKCLTATQCWRDIKHIFKQVELTQPVRTEKRNSGLKAKLEKQLKRYSQRDEVSVTCRILIAWLVARCHSGFMKENLSFPTIQRYASEIFHPILTLVGGDIRSFDEDDFEELYWECIEFGGGDRQYRLGRLYDFHHFLQIHLALPNISWSGLFAFAGLNSVVSSIDANILTIKEYDEAIQTINNDVGLTPWLKACYIMTLMLGYRFGLRFGEVLKLRHIDVQRDENKIFLQIRGSVHGDLKTRSATRQIPLIGKLSEQEEKVWEIVTLETERWIQQDHQTLLLFDGESARTSIDKQQAREYLNKLLKYVSSDKNSRFHHLRHSFANRLVAYAYNLHDPLWNQVSRRLIGRFGTKHLPLLWSSNDEATIKLQAIADVMGHASIRTTMSSYFHFPEILGRALHNQFELNLSPKIMAYMLGQSESTLQKRRERYKSRNDMQAYFAGEPIKNFFPVLTTQLQPATHDCDAWRYTFTQMSEPVTIQMIDKVLVQNARMQNVSASHSNNFSSEVIEKLLLHAANIQAKTRFGFYQVRLEDPDAIGGDEFVGSKFQENVLEAKRVNTQLVLLDKIITEVAAIDAKGFSTQDLATWHVDKQHSKSWRFSTLSSLNAFIELLAFLPLNDAKFELMLPAAFAISDDLNAKLRTHPLRFEIASDKQLKKDALIKLVALPGNCKTFQTVNRVLFCLIVWLHFNYDTAI